MGLLYDVFQHISDPNWDGIVFRKTSTQLRGSGGVFTKASALYKKIGAEVKQSQMRIDFPSGATCRYSYLDTDKDVYNHQGLEYSGIYFDELGQFSRHQFMYLMSRLRSNAEGNSFIKCTLNPQPDSWILDFVGWYLTPDGYADMSKSGRVRWFIVDADGHMDWSEDPYELKAKHGNDCDPISFTFLAASIADNPVLVKMQPNYLTALKNLNRTDREILLYGNWLAVPEASGYFKRDWVSFVKRKDVPKLVRVTRCYDLASSVVSEANPNPDYTACVLMGLGEDGNVYVLHADKFRERPAGVARAMQRYAELDGKHVFIGLPLDPSAAGKVAFESYARPLIMSGYKVKKHPARGSKIDRGLPFSNASENGMVCVVEGEWNKMWLADMEGFTGTKRHEKDDIWDATGDSYNWLISGKKLPEKFTLPSLTKMNEFANNMF